MKKKNQEKKNNYQTTLAFDEKRVRMAFFKAFSFANLKVFNFVESNIFDGETFFMSLLHFAHTLTGLVNPN